MGARSTQATVSGLHFKRALGSLLTASVRFPDLKEQVDAMEADERYPWQDYVSLLCRVTQDLPGAATTRIGARLMEQCKPALIESGRASIEAVLTDFAEAFALIVRGVPAHEGIATEQFDAQACSARIVASAVLPLPLVEGYLRGTIEMFDGWVTSLRVFPLVREGHRAHRIEIGWRVGSG